MREAARSYAKSPEALVVGLARTGDRAAFEELVRRRQSWIRNLMLRLCGDATLADDLAQQALLRAWKDMRRLRQPAAFGGWLKQLAINTWRQHWRKNDVLQNADSSASVEPAQSGGQVVSIGLDLDGALASLAAPVRSCIVLSYHEGMTHSEIAHATQMPLGTVKSHIRRGTERLQQILSAYDATTTDEDSTI